MIKPVLGALGLIAGIAFLPAPVAAQRDEKVLVIFGNDKCPTNAAGSEVVVCSRRPESERFRIPSELRSNATPGSAPNVSAMAVGGTAGSSTCSNIGGGGGNNCFANQMRAAKAEKRQAKAEAAASPAPQ
jgi:hypothetical protein